MRLIKHTEKRNLSLESFCRDGYINSTDDTWKKTDGKKVLYILREENGSNASECDRQGRVIVHRYEDISDFWMKDQLMKDFQHQPLLVKKISRVQWALENNGKEGPCADELNTIHREHMAFMNINKLGGTSSVHWATFNAYLNVFRSFIKREIEILNPDIIVCCGTCGSLECDVYNKQSGIILNGQAAPVIYDCPHPAAWKYTVEAYVKFISKPASDEC